MNEIKIFNSMQFGEIRTTASELGEPMFCLVDLCRILDLKNVSMVRSRLNQDGVSTTEVIDSIGRKQDATFVNEANVYKIIFQSRKPEAESFTDWVTGEILPSIRKIGGYLVAHKDETSEEILARAVVVANNTLSRIKNQLIEQDNKIAIQKQIIEEAAPKVDYYNNVLQSEGCIPITIIAKELGMSAKRLNKKLNVAHIQYKVDKVWVLYDEHVNKGWTKTLTFAPSKTGNKARVGTYWTQEGRRMIHKYFS